MPVPPCPAKASKTRVQTLVDLKSSPFVRRRKFAVGFSDEQEPKPVITAPTPARLRSFMKEKLYIDGWIVSSILDNQISDINLPQNKMDGRYIPEHIPWEFQDVFVPMPWIPEGSIVSKTRFHEVRREQLPRSYSPPPTPPVAHDVLPLNVLPFPAIVPSSTEGPTLKRAASFHPGGSQRLRREASVIDGKVTIDTGFKLRSRSLESIASSSSEPNNMDLVVRQLDSGHQSGLERLKNSMLRLMKAQSHWRRLIVTGERERSELSFPTVGQNVVKDEATEGASTELLAVRRGKPVPSALKLIPAHPLPLVSPYNPEIPVAFRGSPSASTPLSVVTRFLPASGVDKRESIGVEDMCTNLRCLVSPIVTNSAGKEDIIPSKNYCPVADSAEAPGNAMNETPQTPVEEWNFASELEGMYGNDPFSYFGSQERMPSFVRPLSITPDIVTDNTETQRSFGSPATSVSTFPQPPTDNLALPPVPHITISEDKLVPEYPSAQTRSSFSSSATLDPADCDEMTTCTTRSSPETSPRSSEDKDEPLAIRRLTLLARSSVATLKVEDLSSARNLPSLAQETPKSVTKIVRFASDVEERISCEGPEVTCPPRGCQRPRSSSVPPAEKGSFRSQAFLQLDTYKHERLTRSQPTTLPSRIPKKRTLTRIGMYDQHPVTRDVLAPAELENWNDGRKRLSSLIPIAGLKASPVQFPLNQEKAGGGKRVVDRSSRLYIPLKQPSRTSTPRSAQPQQKTPLTASWSTTLKQYVKGGDPSGEKRGISRLRSPGHRGEPALPPNSSVGTKSLLPVKKTSFFRDGLSKATQLSEPHDRTKGRRRTIGRGDGSEGNVVGSVDKTGGISYIAPPKVREGSGSQGRVKGEKQGPSTVAMRTLKPVQIRNLLGRFAT